MAENLFEHVERIPRKREPPQRPVRHVKGVSYSSGMPSGATVAKGLAVMLSVAALVLAIWTGLGALDSNHTSPAPWSRPGAPDLTPAPLSAQ